MREQVHKARIEGVGAAPSRPAGYPKVDSTARIGAAVGSSLNLGFEAPHDAYAVERAVMGCSARRLVRDFALSGAVPDWTPEPVVHWEQGEPIRGPWLRGRIQVIGYCVSLRGDLPEHVAERRATYARWQRGMVEVHAALSRPGALIAHALIGEPPQKAPWDCY